MSGTALFFCSVLVSFLLTVILEKKMIPVLMRIKLGQKILEIGPRWHKSKEGTPTMGGLFFLAGITLVMFVFGLPAALRSGDWSSFVVCAMVLMYGFIGYVDDYVKFIKKQNRGLSPMQKLILQFCVAAAFLFTMKSCGYITTSIALPFTQTSLELGLFYYLFSILFIVLIVNSVNLTDGIDGLAASVTLIILVFFTMISFAKTGTESELPFLGGAIGGLIGFLFYNYHPARIFMGDTGSLALGGLVAGMAYLYHQPLIIVIAGLVYLAEALSVVIQVGYYKLTKKRFFKMAPFHHHLEMCSWSETKIVRVFTAVTTLLCVIAYIAF